jgi:hypothetical protein
VASGLNTCDDGLEPHRSSFDSVWPAAGDTTLGQGGCGSDAQAVTTGALGGAGVWGSWQGGSALQERGVGEGGLGLASSSAGNSSHLDDMTEEDVLWETGDEESDVVSQQGELGHINRGCCEGVSGRRALALHKSKEGAILVQRLHYCTSTAPSLY